ncbi:uncharacterized protein LOC117179674 [Belonocnema kinseyi]|uniref:uncharacterized protein LOC117179674 n=1 Tax=Belonocnema kinseyi TaxID=2817044 RepID=UPI00143DC139|nr:uncharacterized protein LOC117179674 [Belonocnema kinseyi]
MAYEVSEVFSDKSSVKMVTVKKQQSQHPRQNVRKTVGVMGSRRIFPAAFKLKVLHSYRNDIDCRGNQRATARKYGIHRRQIQKWLQCEHTLRSNCAELDVNAGSLVTGNSSGISKLDGPLVESTGLCVSPTSPALNLSLARLHGDELAVQQGPPPLHPPSRNSPSSTEYGFHAALPSRVTPVGYSDYPNPDQQHHPQELEEKIHLQNAHKFASGRVEPERKYFVTNHQNYELDPSVENNNRSEVKLYQPPTAYHSTQYHRYDSSDANATNDHHLHNSQHRHRNYGDLDWPGDGEATRTMLYASAEIKAERPDSTATPGPHEIAGSPSASKFSLSSPQQNIVTTTNESTANFELTRQTSPLYHSHVREHCLSNSEKPCYQEGEKRESKMEGEIELNVVVEEVEEKHGQAEMQEPVGEGEGVPYTDYQRPPAASSLTNLGPISPLQERLEAYSGPSSPQGSESSGRSSSSYSDCEMDPMDYTCHHQNASGDLTRRRSFSLRFKLDVLNAFQRDVSVAGNQRATARKFGINRRQVQKWLGQKTEIRRRIDLLDGNSRQRLGPIQEAVLEEYPVDLTITGVIPSQPEAVLDESSPMLYCCDATGFPARQSYCQLGVRESPDTSIRTCSFSCCVESTTMTSSTSCYQDINLKRVCYAESQESLYCYSPREPIEMNALPLNQELISSKMKIPSCTLSCCYQALPSTKRMCVDTEETCIFFCEEQPAQDTPLCLVKPKKMCKAPLQIEPVTSTVPTPLAPVTPSTPSSKKDAILFKPYLDNPFSKPTDDSVYRELSPVGINNNNCQGICNLNENRGHDYALELNLRVPVSWRTHQIPYSDFPQVRSAFVRYPTNYHYS